MAIDFYSTPGSGPCRAVYLTIKYLGLRVNLKNMDLRGGEHLKSEFLKINPQHTVPAVVDDNFTIWESHAIITYLADKYAKDDTLYPRDVQRRARVVQRLFFDATVLYQRFADAYFPFMFSGVPISKDKIKKLDEAYEFLSKFLDGNEFVAGSNVTLADISIIASVTSMTAVDYDISKYSNVIRWLNKTKTLLPDYEEANEKGVEAFRTFYLSLTRQ